MLSCQRYIEHTLWHRLRIIKPILTHVTCTYGLGFHWIVDKIAHFFKMQCVLEHFGVIHGVLPGHSRVWELCGVGHGGHESRVTGTGCLRYSTPVALASSTTCPCSPAETPVCDAALRVLRTVRTVRARVEDTTGGTTASLSSGFLCFLLHHFASSCWASIPTGVECYFLVEAEDSVDAEDLVFLKLKIPVFT